MALPRRNSQVATLALVALFTTLGVQCVQGNEANVSMEWNPSTAMEAEIDGDDYASYLAFPEDEEPDFEAEYENDQNRSLLGDKDEVDEYDEDEDEEEDEDDRFYMNDTDYEHHLRRQLAYCDDCVVNYNRRVMTGTHRMIGVPVAFSNCKFGSGRKAVPTGELRRVMRYVSEFYNTKSRGAVKLVGTEIASVRKMPQRAKCTAKYAVKRKYAFSSYAVKIAAYACKICGFSNAGGGWVHFGKGKFGAGTLTHEVGHLFGLAHATSVMYDKRKKPMGLDDYGDYTSQMGRRWSASYNAPMHHWLGWLRPYEVKYAEPGKTYKMRALDKVSIDKKDVQAALVYMVPYSSVRMYISLRRRSSGIAKRRHFEKNQVGFAIHLASACHNCRHLKTVLLKHVNPGRYEDETGLVLETKLLDYGAGMATVKVSYDESIARCNKRPEFELKGVWRSTIGTTVTVKMTNTNPGSCRPLFVNPELMTGIYGTSVWYYERSKRWGKKYNSHKLIVGGDTQIRVFKVKRRSDGVAEFVFDFAGSRSRYCIYKDTAAVVSC